MLPEGDTSCLICQIVAGQSGENEGINSSRRNGSSNREVGRIIHSIIVDDAAFGHEPVNFVDDVEFCFAGSWCVIVEGFRLLIPVIRESEIMHAYNIEARTHLDQR